MLQSFQGYCCLGVGVKVLVPEGHQRVDNDGLLLGAYPGSGSPEWLQNINNQFRKDTGSTLVELNDGEQLSFKEIAQKLRETYPVL